MSCHCDALSCMCVKILQQSAHSGINLEGPRGLLIDAALREEWRCHRENMALASVLRTTLGSKAPVRAGKKEGWWEGGTGVRAALAALKLTAHALVPDW